jgi:hypothetical protein
MDGVGSDPIRSPEEGNERLRSRCGIPEGLAVEERETRWMWEEEEEEDGIVISDWRRSVRVRVR